MITVERLIAAGIAPTQAKAFAGPLAAACALFSIDTPVRVAAFVAQASHESTGFARLEESLHYRTPERIRAMFPSSVPSLGEAAKLVGKPQALANRVYAGKNGNGNEASGDGWRYRGRALIQITGRGNYRACTQSGARDYEAHPELLAEPSDACLASAWWWHAHGCNEKADISDSDIDAITLTINGRAMAGRNERRELFREALDAFRA